METYASDHYQLFPGIAFVVKYNRRKFPKFMKHVLHHDSNTAYKQRNMVLRNKEK